MNASILLGSTPRPLLGQIVEIPEHIYTPKDYRNGCEVSFCVGRIVEVSVNLVSVFFFGYPNVCDYSIREANQFTLAAY